MEKPIVGITTGDINGIGPELIIKTLADNRILDICTPVVFSSNKIINYYRKMITEFPLNFNSTKDLSKLNYKQPNVYNCWEEDVTIQPGMLTEQGGKYAVKSLEIATQFLKEGQIDIMVTGPINKSNAYSAAFPYSGHTPYLKETFKAKDVLMLLYSNDFRVALVTEHVPIAEVANHITGDRIHAKLQILKDSLVKDFGIDKPKIAVLGLNPHAGDEGTIGKEEIEIIKPVVDQWQQQGHLVFGPYSADAFFAHDNHSKFDAVLAMYHDQGLIPFKSMALGSGVNFTAGLPSIRISPDHGTAFDIAGKGIAEHSSFMESIFQGISIWNQRKSYATNTANPLRRRKMEKERD
jgi:4-hydroxythreonine-4-phosphate dehydrogenase